MEREHAQPTPSDALLHATLMVGGQSEFGRMIKRRQSTISDWVRFGKVLPAEHVLEAEAGSGVSRHLLRPDIYPLEAGEPVPSLPTLPTKGADVVLNREDISHRDAA